MANPYFNAAFYLANNQDLVLAGFTEANAEDHYNEYGAGEGRAPNSWFDPKAYLLANADLIPGGVTLATALEHFTQYGVNEGRVFNNNPALAPAEFPASDYAAENEDVADALGITDPDDLTPEQETQLLKHFLQYGLNEDRAGAEDYADAAKAPVIEVVEGADELNVGTALNDTFVWEDPSAGAVANVNGLSGVDTLRIVDAAGKATLNASSIEAIEITGGIELEVKGSGVQTLNIDTDGDAVTYAGAKVESVTLKGGNTTTLNLTGVAGSADVLVLNVNGDAVNTVNTAGFEQVDATLGKDIAGLELNLDKVNGESLAVNLSGGADTVDGLKFSSENSGKLSTITIDATGLNGDLEIDADAFGDLAGATAVDLVLNAGAGDDVIDLADGFDGQVVTVNAGAGDDEIHASVGIDTITGGAGSDEFFFTLATAKADIERDGDNEVGINAIDTITDFRAADEGITFEDLTAAEVEVAGVGTVSEAGVLTFQTGYESGKELFDVLNDLSAELDEDEGVLFSWDGATYVFVSGGTADSIADDGIIQLTGVNVADLAITGNSIGFAA